MRVLDLGFGFKDLDKDLYGFVRVSGIEDLGFRLFRVFRVVRV